MSDIERRHHRDALRTDDLPGVTQLLHAFVEKLHRLALRAHRAIGALDVSRVDFRLDTQGNPYLLEINTLPGLNPAVSDLCIMSRAEGLPYAELILEILDLAAARFGLL